MTAQAYSVDI
jgi:hypothetical protein